MGTGTLIRNVLAAALAGVGTFLLLVVAVRSGGSGE